MFIILDKFGVITFGVSDIVSLSSATDGVLLPELYLSLEPSNLIGEKS
jgi:hypothetical protein